MALVLAGIGTVLYLSVEEAFDEQIVQHAADRVDAAEDRDEALAALLVLLLLVGPVALLLATVAGYVLAGAALRPVESMRREATEICRRPRAGGCRCRRRATRCVASARR